MSSLFSLAPSGVCLAFFVTKKPVCSYHTFSPLPWSGGLFSVALSLRLPSPEVIWHRVLIEPGLSSLVYSTKATNQLSGNRLIKQEKPLNQGFFLRFFDKFSAIIKHSLSKIPLISSFLKCLWKAFVTLVKDSVLFLGKKYL